MTNAQRQKSYHDRKRQERKRQQITYRETASSLQEAEQELNRLEYILSLQETDEIYKQLKAENDRVKNSNYRENRKLRDENHTLKMSELDLRRQLTVAESIATHHSTLNDADRRTLVKLLGMLGSQYDGEVVNVARHIEKLRQRIDKSWDGII